LTHASKEALIRLFYEEEMEDKVAYPALPCVMFRQPKEVIEKSDQGVCDFVVISSTGIDLKRVEVELW
jgi:hypothetical protein